MRSMGYASIGIEMGLSVFIGYLIGSWLDERFGSSRFTLIFLLLGVAAGFRSLFRLARQAHAEAQEEDEPDEREEQPRDEVPK